MSRKLSAMQAAVVSLVVAWIFLLGILLLLSLPEGQYPFGKGTVEASRERSPVSVSPPDQDPDGEAEVGRSHALESEGDDAADGGAAKTTLASALLTYSSRASGAAPGDASGIASGNHPYGSEDEPAPASEIDRLVFAKLDELGIEPADLCSDEVFVRRVYLDVIGTLPTTEEVRTFLQDQDPDKRRVLIEALLERPEFADYWALKWCDLFRVKAEFPINLWPNAAQAYHRWVLTAIRENMPYDHFVRELITASGSNFRTPQVNFYRALQNKDPETIAKAVALAFMGARAEGWPAERLSDMALFFSQIGYKSTGEWKEQIVIFDPDAGQIDADAGSPRVVFPDGKAAELVPGEDPRIEFADWLITAENPWFTRHLVNRIWYWLLGRGIVHEPDDIRSGNPPQNRALLDWLGAELVASGYDQKHIYRLILNSSTYQLSCVPKTVSPEATDNFAHYRLRRLDAEVLIDALCQITGTKQDYSSMIPEPFTFIPEDQRSIELPDGSITSPFLEMFGRPPRDTGMESERNNRSTAAQRLHMLNSSHIRKRIQEGPSMRDLWERDEPPGEIAKELYLRILSRFPTDYEMDLVESYCGSRSGCETVAWALINCEEFLHRH